MHGAISMLRIVPQLFGIGPAHQPYEEGCAARVESDPPWLPFSFTRNPPLPPLA
jgi:hypothetical protein